MTQLVALKDLIRPAGSRAGAGTDLPVYSVTKHAGFVPSLEYFKKQVFSRDVAGYRVVEPGQFAYATIHLDEGSIGIAPERSLISPMYNVFSIDHERVEAAYLIRLLKSPWALARYARMGQGAIHRRKSIALTALSALEIPLPAIEEQRRIAAILDQADVIRTKHRQILTHFDSLTESLSRGFFSSVAHDARPLGDLATKVVVGHVGPTSEYFRESGIPLLRTGNVGNGVVNVNDLRYVTEEFHNRLRKSQLTSGDVLVSRVITDRVRAALLPSSLDGANCANIIVVRPSASLLGSTILGYLSLAETQRHLLGRKVGSAQGVVNTTVLKKLPIPLVSGEDQRRFERIVSGIQEQRSYAERALAADDELFASLQSRAFRGEL